MEYHIHKQCLFKMCGTNGQTINHCIFCLIYKRVKWLHAFSTTLTGKIRMYIQQTETHHTDLILVQKCDTKEDLAKINLEPKYDFD